MYSVVICPECEKIFLVKDMPNRTNCRRCRKSLKFDKLKKFYQGEDKLMAIRSRTLAKNEFDNRDIKRRTDEAVEIIEKKIQETTPKELAMDIIIEEREIKYEELKSSIVERLECSEHEVEASIEELQKEEEDIILTPEDKIKYISTF